MEAFEVHITGEDSIIRELKEMGRKSIEIDLLTPSGERHRTEFMSSIILHELNYEKCLENVLRIVSLIESHIIRVKIECPPYEHYLSQALYAESHFTPVDVNYPLSRNVKTQKKMGTDREYDKFKFLDFISKWTNKAEVELCLFDTFVEEDSDWFELY